MPIACTLFEITTLWTRQPQVSAQHTTLQPPAPNLAAAPHGIKHKTARDIGR